MIMMIRMMAVVIMIFIECCTHLLIFTISLLSLGKIRHKEMMNPSKKVCSSLPSLPSHYLFKFFFTHTESLGFDNRDS